MTSGLLAAYCRSMVTFPVSIVIRPPPQKPRRSRANLRPPSRSACVIDRLLKNQNPLENCNNLRSSSPHLVVGRRPEIRAAILRSEIHEHGSHWCSVPDIRRLAVALGGSRRLA